MRRKAAVFVLIASFALLGSMSPALAADARPVGSVAGVNEWPLEPGAVQLSAPRNPALVTILAFVRRELSHPARLAAHWR